MKIALVVFIAVTLLLAAWILVVRHMIARMRARRQRPCFRCALVAQAEFMGLHYCLMCRMVVAQMLPVVRHDPPYGFPGASGYLEFPEEQKEPTLVQGKKES